MVLVLSTGSLVADGAEHALRLGVDLTGGGQLLDDCADTACGVELLHRVGGVVRVDGAQQGHLAGNLVEGLRRDVEAALTCHCGDVQQAVGAAAGRHHIADDILEAGLAQDVAGTDLMLPRVHDLAGSLTRQIVPLLGLAAGAGVVMRRKAEDLGHGAHGLGGAHEGAGAGGGAGVADDILVLLAGDGALDVSGVGLLGVGQGDHAAVRAVTGCHVAAGEHDGGDINADSTHQHTGHNLVAGRHDDHAFQHVQVGNHLDLTGNEVTGGQGVTVAGGVAADAVADAADGQLQREAAELVDFFLHLSDEVLVKRVVAGVHLVPSVDKADDGALGVLLGNAHGVQQGIAVVDRFFIPFANHILCSLSAAAAPPLIFTLSIAFISASDGWQNRRSPVLHRSQGYGRLPFV